MEVEDRRGALEGAEYPVSERSGRAAGVEDVLSVEGEQPERNDVYVLYEHMGINVGRYKLCFK